MSRPCPKCGSATLEKVADHHYRESGLDYVWLASVPQRHCTQCDYVRVSIPALLDLHRALAAFLATARFRLGPNEVRFLRTHLGQSREDYAKAYNIDPADQYAWEAGTKPIPSDQELSLRIRALTIEPVTTYPPETRLPPEHPTAARPTERAIMRRVQGRWADAPSAYA